MQITIKNKFNWNLREATNIIKTTATSYIALCAFGPEEINLDKYLMENYKIGLKAWCGQIIKEVRINLSSDGIVITTLPNTKIDEIATFISCGEPLLSVQGSPILNNAFMRCE